MNIISSNHFNEKAKTLNKQKKEELRQFIEILKSKTTMSSEEEEQISDGIFRRRLKEFNILFSLEKLNSGDSLVLLDLIENSEIHKDTGWLDKSNVEVVAGDKLQKTIYKLYTELPQNVSKKTFAELTSQIIWRLSRIGILVFLLLLIPMILLYRQNMLINYQNYSFEKQNQMIDVQTELMEADRRSSLIFLLSNTLDKIDEELKVDGGLNFKNQKSLSPPLIGRISALSYSFKPYKYYENGKLNDVPLSPERGQLLIALVNSNLNSSTYKKIFELSNFSHCDLQGVNLSNADLNGINLSNSDLSKADLSNANLINANLVNCNFKNTNLKGANLDPTILKTLNLMKDNFKD